ncbi:flagellar brake protein [Inediibacterium massiliense]|uniref:flagellar brake protein n=1 Tax=Inediibacterium massiliense TaxID=1658111 RepID=UPI0006B66F78|nr:PilZ domain-containing protein [Inediibacterium massiliense]
MKNKILPKLGTKIQIEWIDVQKTNDMKYLTSKIMDMIDEDTMIIATPTYKNITAPIPVDAQIKISYFKQNLGIYGFRAKIIERKNDQGWSYLKVKRMGAVFRIQRRDFYRLAVVLSGKLTIKEKGRGEKIAFLTKDISGGGLRAIIKEEIEKGSIVEIDLLIDEKLVFARGEILRCISSDETKGDYDIGIAFKEIDEKDREQIISFIFETERKMRQRGLV